MYNIKSDKTSMIDLEHTYQDNYRVIIWKPRRGETIIAPG